MNKEKYFYSKYILDENNSPINVSGRTCSKWFETFDKRIIKSTNLFNDRVTVSSIFVGIPQEDGMFETAIFDWRVLASCARARKSCHTYEDCLEDHDDLITEARKRENRRILLNRKEGVNNESM